MNALSNKTLWIGFVAVYLVATALGYVVHEVLLADIYMAHASAFRPVEEMDAMMWMMSVGMALYLWLFCFIFTKGYEGKGLMEGARYGLLMGLFLSIPAAVDQYVVYPLSTQLVVWWFVSGVVMFVICGMVLAAIYKPKTS